MRRYICRRRCRRVVVLFVDDDNQSLLRRPLRQSTQIRLRIESGYNGRSDFNGFRKCLLSGNFVFDFRFLLSSFFSVNFDIFDLDEVTGSVRYFRFRFRFGLGGSFNVGLVSGLFLSVEFLRIFFGGSGRGDFELEEML